ncbi:MAG: hypothetical protein ACKO43_04125 [Alphaproteobacteria bacterium]
MKTWTLTLSLAAICCFVGLNIALLGIFSKPFSPVVVYFEEQFHVEAAKTFAQFGLDHNAGLATLSKQWFIDTFVNGDRMIENPKQDYFVYTHYPSFTDLLAGIGASVFGTEKVYPLRILTLLINSVLLWVFLRHALALFPQKRVQIGFLAFFTLMAPMGWMSLHAITHHGYALYISLAFIGVMLPVFEPAHPMLTKHAKTLALLFGFLTGLFTFDYFFIALGTPLAVCCLFHGKEALTQTSLRRLWLILGFWTGVGFTLAHALHFMQVVVYYGSFATAFQDIFGSALYRLTGNAENYRFVSGLRERDDCISAYCDVIHNLGPIAGRFQLIWDYIVLWTADNPPFSHADITPLSRSGFYLTIPIIAWGLVSMAGTFIYKKTALTSCGVLFLLTVILASVWIFLFLDHGTVHIHLLPRHYYFSFILLALFMFRLFSSKTKDQASAAFKAPSGVS